MDKLKLKVQLKKRKPTFLAQDSHKHKKITKRWRKPRGSDSKIKHKLKGRRCRVEVGYGTPKALRNFTLAGLQKVHISTMDQLKVVDAKKQCVVLSGKLGGRKRIELLKVCKEMKVKVLGFKDLDKKIESLTPVKKTKVEKKTTKKEAKSDKEDATTEAKK